jgi:hypothetical protein
VPTGAPTAEAQGAAAKGTKASKHKGMINNFIFSSRPRRNARTGFLA